MKYQHIVFDIDGTLINTEHTILHSLQDTFEKCIHEKVPIKRLLKEDTWIIMKNGCNGQ